MAIIHFPKKILNLYISYFNLSSKENSVIQQDSQTLGTLSSAYKDFFLNKSDDQKSAQLIHLSIFWYNFCPEYASFGQIPRLI